jgi:SAM-dependent methyltransferase
MSFNVAADSYDRFMGRYSAPLAPQLADFAAIADGQRVLDVGCGPGALTAELVTRLGPDSVAAVDPSEPFVAAARERNLGVDVQRATAEQLPFEDDAFDAALAQLVVHFMADPVAGLREMARVTRNGGVVAACVWDLAGGTAPLSVFWESAHEFDPNAEDESKLAGAREGHLGELFRAAGLEDVEEGALTVDVEHPSFEDWWEPFTFGVGPAGAYAAGLDATRQAELRERCRQKFPAPPFVLTARAWAARGKA